MVLGMRRWRLNSGYNGATDQRRTQAGTIPMLKHYMERNLGTFSSSNEWTPAQITTSLWLDAADASTITESGGAVSQWDDKSGNGRNVVQASSANQPTYDATGLNGKPTLSFDGTNDSLKNATYEPSGAVSVFVVLNRTENKGVVVNIKRSDGIFEISGKFDSSYKTVTLTAKGNVNPSFGFDVAGDGVDENNILGIQHDGGANATGNFTGHWNGIEQTIVNSGALGFVSETGFSIGGRPVQNISAAYYSGSISEIIFINNTTSTTDRQLIEGYLAHKWGLTANLPADHPYKNAAPTV